MFEGLIAISNIFAIISGNASKIATITSVIKSISFGKSPKILSITATNKVGNCSMVFGSAFIIPFINYCCC